ncbi:MAG TPA: hypothetical protein V6D29_23170 [Leptolyngbyaceae cyanobacterium]
MTDSPFGKTVIGRLKSTLGLVGSVAIMSCLITPLTPKAQASTVIISTGGVTLSTPGFFLSIGNPVVFYPPVVAYPPIVAYPPTIYFPPYPVLSHPYTYPVHSPRYRLLGHPPLVLDDGVSMQVQPGEMVGSVSADVSNSDPYPSANRYVTQLGEVDPLVRFTSNPMPWVEVEDLSTTPSVSTVQVAPSVQSEPSVNTYRISSPDPFNSSLRSLGQ